MLDPVGAVVVVSPFVLLELLSAAAVADVLVVEVTVGVVTLVVAAFAVSNLVSVEVAVSVGLLC